MCGEVSTPLLGLISGALGSSRLISAPLGKVSKPLLGLGEAAFHGLGRRTDFIIHVAAEVNMVKPPQVRGAERSREEPRGAERGREGPR